MALRIELGYDDPPADVWNLELVNGRIRVFVDGDCLTAFRPSGPAPAEWRLYDVDGNPIEDTECPFVGEWVTPTIGHIEQAVLTILRGEDETHEQIPARVSSGAGDPYVFLFSRIDENNVRIAFQHRHWNRDDRTLPRPTLAAARGFVVSIPDLCTGVADALETQCMYLRRSLEHVNDEYPVDKIHPEIERTETVIETLLTNAKEHR